MIFRVCYVAIATLMLRHPIRLMLPNLLLLSYRHISRNPQCECAGTSFPMQSSVQQTQHMDLCDDADVMIKEGSRKPSGLRFKPQKTRSMKEGVDEFRKTLLSPFIAPLIMMCTTRCPYNLSILQIKCNIVNVILQSINSMQMMLTLLLIQN